MNLTSIPRETFSTEKRFPSDPLPKDFNNIDKLRRFPHCYHFNDLYLIRSGF